MARFGRREVIKFLRFGKRVQKAETLKESAKTSTFDVFEQDPMSFADIDSAGLVAVHQVRMLKARHQPSQTLGYGKE